MPLSIASGPYSVTGDPVFPVPTQPRKLAAGDVLWIDSGINLHGYASDFGATWVVGNEPAVVVDFQGMIDYAAAH